MKQIYQLDDTIFKFDEEKKCLYQFWGDVTPEDFIQANAILPELIVKYPFACTISRTPKTTLIRSKDVQWVVSKIIPDLVDNGLLKIAYIVSSDQMAEQAVRTFIREIGDKMLLTGMFNTMEDAEEWIFSNK